MPEPKRKRSRARRDKRFANKGMKVKSFAACDSCQAPNLPHTLCRSCGFYKGAKVMTGKLDKSLKKAEAMQAKMAAASASEQQA